MSLRGIAGLFGLSYERVRQITTSGWRARTRRPRKLPRPRYPELEGRHKKALELDLPEASAREIADMIGVLEITVCRWLGRSYAGYVQEEHQALTIERTGPPPAEYSIRLPKGPPRPCVICGRKTEIRIGWPDYEHEGDPVDDGCRLAYERQWGLYL